MTAEPQVRSVKLTCANSGESVLTRKHRETTLFRHASALSGPAGTSGISEPGTGGLMSGSHGMIVKFGNYILHG